MKRTNSAITALIIVSAILAVLIFGIRFTFFGETFTPLKARQEAAAAASKQTLSNFFAAFESGDMASAEKLAVNFTAESELMSAEISELAGSSLSYTVTSSTLNKDGSVTNSVEVKWLNVDKLTGDMNDEIQSILDEMVEASDNSSEVYDENLNFRQDVFDSVYNEVLEKHMANSSAYMEESSILIKTTAEAPARVIISDELFSILMNGRESR